MTTPKRRAKGRRAVAALACAAVTVSGALVAADEVIERVLAVVAGDLILASDLTAARQFHLVETDPAADDRAALTGLIDRALVLAEVERYAPREPDDKTIDASFEDARTRFRSAEAFQTALARTGLNERQLRERLRQQLRIQAYVEQRFTVPAPSDDEVAAFYDAHPDRYIRLGRLAPLAEVRESVVREMAADRRRAQVDEWVTGLRRRAQIIDLSVR